MNRILQALLLLSITYLSLPGQDPAAIPDTLPSPADSDQPAAIPDTLPSPADSDQPAAIPDTFSLQDTTAPGTIPETDPERTTLSDTVLPFEEYRDLDLERSAIFDTIPPDLSGDVRTGRRARQRNDTLLVRELNPDHSPSTAIMYALVLPGLGQGYNEKYYKIPIVAAAFGGVGYAINFNTQKFREASRVYAEEQNDYSERYLRYWRRNMELSYISLIAVYALQVIDAYVDAQLYYWDVNENLSMRVAPSLQQLMAPSGMVRPGYGLTCSIDFKGRR